MRSGIFFERDGILNRIRVERGSQITPRSLDEFHLNPEAVEPLRRLKEAGFVLLATTNQPGISRGYLARREMDRMHEVLRRGLPLNDILVCPHDETDHCPCRKPRPGLLTEGAFKWHLDLERSFVISDKWQDAQAAHIAGCTSLMLKSPWIGQGHHDYVLASLAQAADKIFEFQGSNLLLMDQI